MITDKTPKNKSRTRGGGKLYAAVRAAFALCLAAAFAATLLICTDAGRCVVRVREGGDTAKAVRTETPGDWREWLEERGYALNADDGVTELRVGGAVTLDIARAFPVTIKTTLRERTVYTTDTTVGALLARERVTLGENDEVEPAPETKLHESGVVTVRRVMFAERETTERVSGAAITRPSPLIANGESYEASTYYSDGIATRLYRDKYVDGQLVSSEILLEDMDPAPVNAVTLVGDDTAVVSELDEKYFTEFGADGVPTQYERVISGAVCTAYSFSPGVYGSTGMHLFAGCVAVDPERIPLGSLLYIRSADGAFTYGFAVAADYCEAASWGVVDADLFFETYNESALFGKRKLDIYVIKQLYQDELRRYVEDSAAGMFALRIPAE